MAFTQQPTLHTDALDSREISPTWATLEDGMNTDKLMSDSQVGFIMVREAEKQRSDAAGSFMFIKLSGSLAVTAVLSEHHRKPRLVHQPEWRCYCQLKIIIIIIKRTSRAPHLVWARSASQ